MKFTDEELEYLQAASNHLDADEMEAIREAVAELVARDKLAEEVEAIMYRAARR